MRKGALTRERIVEQALELAGRDGLGGVSLGQLADRVGMSKSGLFAHFKSKDELHLEIIRAASESFRREVFDPALRSARGEPRLRAIIERWIAWDDDPGRPGGCPISQLAAELDDQPGPAREALVETQQNWMNALSHAVRLAVDEGHLRGDTDPELFAFQVNGIFLSFHQSRRLLRDPRAKARVRAAFKQLLAGHQAR
jgi:AcrR family transcriptional regulator